MPENTAAENTATENTENMTGAEWAAHERQEARIAYAVDQLKQGKYLTLTNGSDGDVIGTCAHAPREGREHMTRLLESGVRKWD
ncbi:hypothetical protein AB0J01_41255 [Streptomyces sp. NPDC050204]|uniref:hypothetical protein n=1 Tax=Streptomyces sp. NPDC050204 TaxID=3155514 RepID=UPI00342F99C2